ncbi:MAG: D-glycero-beta-D-manno-heptose 1-phosphate adenylyltransferase [Candidatus Eisenbacteria bacterium]|uniref:D-glycero-beta-D-manno-heptose 1-phosphate adenylyltransferase n=1 Tax=Eiseniibacteriota bacterium TaxID=2212470 RepID=A0A538U9D2_UNCEI|nr:MAG: D-glycero-beta-D-manno-heptose 1-phosphate adenylyltransferase [Candidatus Eisenbacteria bacterium]
MNAARWTQEARDALAAWRRSGESLVFTNGVFDLLHRGHVEYLEDAAALGDRLIIGLNGDASVRRLKGEGRPLVPEEERAELIRALACVDLCVIFDEDTPERLIQDVAPDVLVKGGDWPLDRIVGRGFVESRGGRVLTVPVRAGHSTTRLVARIRDGRSALDP